MTTETYEPPVKLGRGIGEALAELARTLQASGNDRIPENESLSAAQLPEFDHEDIESQEWLKKQADALNDVGRKTALRTARAQNATNFATRKPEENKVVGDVWR